MTADTSGIEDLPRLQLAHPSGSAAEVSLYGGQVTRWVDGTGREHLYLSRRARFGGGVSIRGGIPVVFPQFAHDGPLPKHGLLRTREWSLTRHDTSSATLSIQDDDSTRALWPKAFLAELTVSVAESLRLELTVTNTGNAPLSFVAALHTFFAVDDVRAAGVIGLSGCGYRDKVREGTEVIDGDSVVTIAGETDRVYHRGPSALWLAGVGGGGKIAIETDGFGDWVVWNPWVRLTSSFTDMEPQDYLRMLCVEAARLADPVSLTPGAHWTGIKLMRTTTDEATG